MSMSVDDYVELRKKELDEFAAYWKQQNTKLPDQFPASFDRAADWFEQEACYNDRQFG